MVCSSSENGGFDINFELLIGSVGFLWTKDFYVVNPLQIECVVVHDQQQEYILQSYSPKFCL